MGNGALQTATRPAREALEPARFGTWLFLASEVLLFAGLIGAYLFLRTGRGDLGAPSTHPGVALASVASVLLGASSLALSRCTSALRSVQPARARRWLAITLLLGLVFLGCQAWEWRALLGAGLAPRTNLYWSSYFVLTGVHGLHVAGGLGALGWFGPRSLRAGAPALPLEMASLYWHFVDAVWIVLFVLLYLS